MPQKSFFLSDDYPNTFNNQLKLYEDDIIGKMNRREIFAICTFLEWFVSLSRFVIHLQGVYFKV